MHHDSRGYDEAVGEAASKARVKLEETIHRGVSSAMAVVEEVQSKVLVDRVARAPAVRVVPDGEGGFGLSVDYDVSPLHRHALGQVMTDAGLGVSFMNKLRQEPDEDGSGWADGLVAHNVNTILAHRTSQRNLVRSEGSEGIVKGFLSDRFRRLDSRPMLDAFIGACHGEGVVPIEGLASDTKCRVRAVLPRVFEPVRGEVMAFGLEWGNSDFGDGGHVVNLWTMRIVCTNLAITDRVLRQIHLGKALSDDIRYSEETYRLDTATNVSALKDVVRHAIGPGRVNAMLEAVRTAGETEFRGRDVEAILKRGLEKSDVEQVKSLFHGPDVVNMPAGETAWRLSNAVSWFAQFPGHGADRRMELQRLAGEIIPHKEAKVLEV